MKSQFTKLGKKHKESVQQQRKLESVIDSLNKDKTSLKKELIESKYEAKQKELLFKNSQDEVLSLKSELKAKGRLILTLEKERRKLEMQVIRAERDSRSRDREFNSSKIRSVSADRFDEKKRNLGRQLIKTGQGSAYAVTANIDPDSVGEQEVEKVVMLTRLLLSKTRINAQKDLQIESLLKEKNHLSDQISRLKKTKYLAEELTQHRHRLAVKTKQLEALVKEDSKNRQELVTLRTEVIKMRDKLQELYTERTQYLNRRTPSNN